MGRALLPANFLHIRDHMPQNIQSDQIDSAKRSRLRPADGLSGERIDIFNAEVHLLHQVHDVQHREGADAVGDEVASVFREDDSFAHPQIAKVRDRIEQSAVGIRRGNNFKQAHVPWRIEKVRAEP